MKHRILYITAWLLLLTFKAVNTGPEAEASFEPYMAVVKISPNTDSLPSDGKEERSEWFKLVSRPSLAGVAIDLSEHPLRFFEFPHRLKRQVYLPIHLPPPKFVA